MLSRATSLRNLGCGDLGNKVHCKLSSDENSVASAEGERENNSASKVVSDDDKSLASVDAFTNDDTTARETLGSYSQLSFRDLNESLSLLPVVVCDMNHVEIEMEDEILKNIKAGGETTDDEESFGLPATSETKDTAIAGTQQTQTEECVASFPDLCQKEQKTSSPAKKPKSPCKQVKLKVPAPQISAPARPRLTRRNSMSDMNATDSRFAPRKEGLSRPALVKSKSTRVMMMSTTDSDGFPVASRRASMGYVVESSSREEERSAMEPDKLRPRLKRRSSLTHTGCTNKGSNKAYQAVASGATTKTTLSRSNSDRRLSLGRTGSRRKLTGARSQSNRSLATRKTCPTTSLWGNSSSHSLLSVAEGF